MIELLTAIAIWCGNATPGYGLDTKTVNQCREELLTCAQISVGFEVKTKSQFELLKCFRERRL